MARSSRHVQKTPPEGNAFTSNLRFELIDEEERALLGSYAISTALGVAFLLLIQFGPRIEIVVPPPVVEVGPIVFPRPEPTVIRDEDDSDTRKSAGPSRGSAIGRTTESIGKAFGAGVAAIVGQPSNILGAVQVTRGAGVSTSEGGKTVLAYGEQGGAGSIPGRGGITSGGNGSPGGIGGVAGGAGGVAHAGASVSMPVSIPVAPLTPSGDAATVGTFVRGHESQLRFCYEEHGLKVNPRLAGSVTVAITAGGSGAVTNASVVRRSWSGAGTAESEACIVKAIRGWQLPAGGSYTFPFNFSR